MTEGEHKADKLAALGLVATTSGAADSAARADWQPLAGRGVMIWPDFDEPGQRYADTVAAVLQPLGCRVRVVDVATLALPLKGDAVDWLEQHPHATAVDVLALPCVEPEPQHEVLHRQAHAETESPSAPNTCKYGGGRFELTERGVFFVGTDKNGNDNAPAWICSPLGVVAKTRDDKSGEWGRLLEWFDDDGVRHQWAMLLELLEGDGVDVRRELVRRGLSTGTTKPARDWLAAYIKVWPVQQRARCVERLGWHQGVYVLPAQTIGDAEEIVVFQSTHGLEPAFGVRGTVEEWRDSVAALAAGNTRVVLALSVAFAGSLASIAEEDSGGFHLRGKSSSGKSTALKAAASVWGSPATYPRVWRATTNGLEGLAAVHNDGLLILDELSQCDPREAGEAAYLLANGQGKARASRSGTARASQRWRLMFLSAGEESLSALMAQGRPQGQHRAGDPFGGFRGRRRHGPGRLNYQVDGRAVDDEVMLTTTPCTYGGARYWFSCPRCSRRCAVMYLRRGRFHCRQCQQVGYLTQSEDACGRAWCRQSKAEAKLAANWQRPKGMHRRTHERLIQMISECEEAREAALAGVLQRLGWPG